MSNDGLKGSANGNGNGKPNSASKTIDLQGVAAFAQLVELLAQELGTSPGRMQGMLPSGPASFEELVGEIVVNSQGFERNLVLATKPGSPLKIRFQSMWRNGDGADSTLTGVESHYFLDATVEQIVPQGRALARYIEDTFTVMDRMVTLGGGKINNQSISDSEIAAFENSEAGTLVRMRSSVEKAESFVPQPQNN